MPVAMRRGFTLVELIVATAIMGILMAAVGSALMVAARAVPSPDSSEARAASATSAAREMAGEISQAITVTAASATGITFSVPDRTGDNAPETITYAITGTPLISVTRTFNGGEATVIAQGLSSAALAYAVGSREVTTLTPVEGPEHVMSACYETSGSELPFNGSTVAIQKFRPALPPEAASWRVTRVNLWCKQDAPVNSTLRLQVYRTDSTGTPSGSSLAATTLSEAAMPSAFGWRAMFLSSMPSLLPTDGVALVLANNSLSVNVNLGLVTFSIGGSPTAGMGLFVTDSIAEDGVNLSFTTNGSTWNHQADDSLVIEVLGRVTAPVAGVTTVDTIDTVEVALTVKGWGQARAITPVHPRPASPVAAGSLPLIGTLPEILLGDESIGAGIGISKK
ncbi:MAG: type II secretion system protein [Phycisphaeraceae bacterium]|nr:type II secretion system protein [Phycisphaerae bacterium]MBX3391469.1 type II secretion system protein [Phycisphaeraceae bacterium]HRJ49728.1 type II secretion system protein [Phycisphaerales bacterium]